MEHGELRDYTKARHKMFYEEELDVPLVHCNEELDHVLRIDRIFQVHNKHSGEDLDKDRRQELRRSGCKDEKICTILDELGNIDKEKPQQAQKCFEPATDFSFSTRLASILGSRMMTMATQTLQKASSTNIIIQETKI